MKLHRLAACATFSVLLGFNGISQGMLITHIQDSILPQNVVYDDNADRYWIHNLGYNTQLQSINHINANNAYQSPLRGGWRFTALSDVETLWLNSYTVLRDAFTNSDAGLHEITGRYENAGLSKDEGYLVLTRYYIGLAYFSQNTIDLPETLIPDIVLEDWLGGWGTADPTVTNPVQRPTTILLYGMGLIVFAGLRRKLGKG